MTVTLELHKKPVMIGILDYHLKNMIGKLF
jgi:hypothetical protein